MELIKATSKIIDQSPGIKGIYEQIELPGRICYGSQDKIADGTAEPFVNQLMKSNHGAPLEHNGVYLDCPKEVADKYIHNKYSKTNFINDKYYVSTNFRVLFENGWLDDLKYFVEPTQYHEKRITVSFNVDRFTGEEFLRHRSASFNRESTRYVNYNKDKFGGGNIKFITPPWIDESVKPINNYTFKELCYDIYIYADYNKFSDVQYWLFAIKAAEYAYNNLIRLGWEPQQARTVLSCAINSPLIKTAFVSDWCHFFNLRALGTTGKPHPQAKELAEPLMNEFIERGLIVLKDNPNVEQRITIPYICIPASIDKEIADNVFTYSFSENLDNYIYIDVPKDKIIEYSYEKND